MRIPIHPADRDRVRAAFAATRAVVGPYEIDFRIIVADELRWISARGQGDDAGIVDRVMFGIFLDVTGRKQAEEGHELLAGEMSHRVKNLLAIASALTAITSKSTTSKNDMARELTQRLTALGRAHDLVRPIPGHQGKAALLGDLFTVLLAPYDDQGAFAGRIRVAVPRMGLGEASTTTLAMVIHELATNSLKYGALSTSTGTLDVSSPPDGSDLVIVWTERGGPPVSAPDGGGGFGSKLVARSLETQLGGSLDCEWLEEGVVVTLKLSKDKASKSLSVPALVARFTWSGRHIRVPVARNVCSRLQFVQTNISFCFPKVRAVGSISLSRSSPPHMQRNEGGGSTRGRM